VTLLLTAGGAALALAVLGAGSLWRLLARRDHRCTVGSLRQGCEDCAATVQGGHVLCACGVVSPHLHGTALLVWRAEHQGEQFPGAPGTVRRPAPEEENEPEDARALAAIEAEDESIRRAVVRARRSPDPRTPQVLREVARDLGATDVNRG
jgi:hypothetical protein